MKKKVIAIVCAVAVLAAAGGGVTWHFLGNSTKEDDNVVYVLSLIHISEPTRH